jgi:hypothetical protein
MLFKQIEVSRLSLGNEKREIGEKSEEDTWRCVS